MSIIIGIISKENNLIIGADTRAVLHNGTINDNFQKLFKIRHNLFIGITGIAEYGIGVIKGLLEFERIKDLTNKEIIDLINLNYPILKLDSTILIAGKNDNNIAFIWTKSTTGTIELLEGNGRDVFYSINSTSNIDSFESKLKQTIVSTNHDYFISVMKTIQYASEIDKTISSKSDIYQI